MNWLDAQEIISSFGDYALFAVSLIVFFETAFIPASFLPGDSLLFLMGLTLANSTSVLPDWIAFMLVWGAAFLGPQVSFYLGRRFGTALFASNRKWLLNDKVLEKTNRFFDRYGARAVILARFVPILRSVVPVMAGSSDMQSKRFLRLNLIGATLWILAFMVPGYWLGGIELIKENLEITVLAVIVISALPLPLELIRESISRKKSESARN